MTMAVVVMVMMTAVAVVVMTVVVCASSTLSGHACFSLLALLTLPFTGE